VCPARPTGVSARAPGHTAPRRPQWNPPTCPTRTRRPRRASRAAPLARHPVRGQPRPLERDHRRAGVQVGYTTLIEGDSSHGVTAIIRAARRARRRGRGGLLLAERQRRDDRRLVDRGRVPSRCRSSSPAPTRSGSPTPRSSPWTARHHPELGDTAPAGGGGDLGRLPERRGRAPRHRADGDRRHGVRRHWPGGGRIGRRRNRHVLLRFRAATAPHPGWWTTPERATPWAFLRPTSGHGGADPRRAPARRAAGQRQPKASYAAPPEPVGDRDRGHRAPLLPISARRWPAGSPSASRAPAPPAPTPATCSSPSPPPIPAGSAHDPDTGEGAASGTTGSRSSWGY
jgi:hypothetical protein